MPILNLGILAHVDAGKTTLTERLLYVAGVIDQIGSVDAGSTQTDFLPLERQRGITIRSAVVSFAVDGITINLIDTPGHPDFIAEVERVLRVLDGVVLVISAVEGVQVQTRILMRTLQRLRIPTIMFVNKIDRGGAGYNSVIRSISERLTPAIVAMGTTEAMGSAEARSEPFDDSNAQFTSRLIDVIADHDDDFMDRFAQDDRAFTYPELRARLAGLSKRALAHPVFFGSAVTGAGVRQLMAGIKEFLPMAESEIEGPASGYVFKVERGPVGEKIAYVRMFMGAVRTRDRLRLDGNQEAKVTGISLFKDGASVEGSSVAAGQIGKLRGLSGVQIGDTFGEPRSVSEQQFFDPPTLETAVVPRHPSEKGALRTALSLLTEQDPLINLRQDDIRQEMYVSLYGEVQKEVIEATLKTDFDVEVEFRETSAVCVERPNGRAEAVEWLGKGNPFLATVGLRVEPTPVDTGLEFRLEAQLVTVPLYVYKAVNEFRQAMEDTVRTALEQGLFGWRVTDCIVTMTHSGYAAPSTSSRDFRLLTPLMLLSALKEAGTTVCEPIHRFCAEIPVDAFGSVVPLVARLGGELRSSEMRGSMYVLVGEIAATRVQELRQQLSPATHGEGVLECSFAGYRPVSGSPPTRPRWDYNPLNRKEYLLHIAKRL